MLKVAEVGLHELPLKVNFVTSFDKINALILVEKPTGGSVTILENI
jgi:hypothetical protein